MPTKIVLGDPRQAHMHQRTQSLHFPSSFIITRPLPAARALKHQAPCLIHEHSTGSERVDALGRAVEAIICMITRDFSVISIDVTGVSLSLSLSLSLSQKSLTHNIGSASALPIITLETRPAGGVNRPDSVLAKVGKLPVNLKSTSMTRRRYS